MKLLMTVLSLFLLLIMNIVVIKNHIFLLLLWLEIIILFFVMSVLVSPINSIVSVGTLVIILLAIAVCEASVALATLVNLSRHSSHVSIKALNTLKC